MGVETRVSEDTEREYGFRISAKLNGIEVPNTGYFYVWDKESQAIRHSIYIHPDYQGNGIGKALIERFRQEVGSGQPMVGEINHSESQKYVLSSSWPLKALHGAIELPRDFFRTIPAVRVMMSGGLKVEQMQLTYFPHTHAVLLPFWGKT